MYGNGLEATIEVEMKGVGMTNTVYKVILCVLLPFVDERCRRQFACNQKSLLITGVIKSLG